MTGDPAVPGLEAVALTFLGAAGEVTGSAFLLEVGARRVLVDCGLFQGPDADAKNRAALALDVRTIDAVVLTHAHIDHSGLLPLLVKRGYEGQVYATRATGDLLGVMLPDSAHIQESDAAWAHELRLRAAPPRSHPSRRGVADEEDAPLYTVHDAEAALHRLEAVDYGVAHTLFPGIAFTFRNAGHILGSAIAEFAIGSGGAIRRIVFSGDLGQPGRPVMPDPDRVARADALVVESTYGDRLHRSLEATLDELSTVLTATLPRGNVVVPAFAVGRTQEILHVLAELARAGRVPALTVFVDSPLATAATAITARYASQLDRETRDLTAWQRAHPERLRILFTESPQDSMRINTVRSGAVIVAASGMAEGGRVRHHLRHNLPRGECAIVFTGFQARGTLGRSIVDGAREVRLFRESVPVRASVHTIGGLSAHADRGGLLAWLAGFTAPPGRVFVVHGERETSVGFAAAIREQLGWRSVEVPARGDRVPLFAASR
jgi:metallo-beta-lactamase family protein